MVRPVTVTQFTAGVSGWLSMRRAAHRAELCCLGSASTSSVSSPRLTASVARLTATVVLPVPPFSAPMTIVFMRSPPEFHWQENYLAREFLDRIPRVDRFAYTGQSSKVMPARGLRDSDQIGR